MIFNDFPLELREIILFSIYDLKTILNARFVSNDWYKILKIVREYLDYGVIIEHSFSNDIYFSKNVRLNLPIKKMEFKKFGKYIYTEYVDNGPIYKKVESFPPYKLIYTEYSYTMTIIKEYDIRKNDIKKMINHNYFLGNQCAIS
jgi:hypothetical protein